MANQDNHGHRGFTRRHVTDACSICDRHYRGQMSVCHKAVPDGYLPASDPAQVARLSQTSPTVWLGKFDDVLHTASTTSESPHCCQRHFVPRHQIQPPAERLVTKVQGPGNICGSLGGRVGGKHLALAAYRELNFKGDSKGPASLLTLLSTMTSYRNGLCNIPCILAVVLLGGPCCCYTHFEAEKAFPFIKRRA